MVDFVTRGNRLIVPGANGEILAEYRIERNKVSAYKDGVLLDRYSGTQAAALAVEAALDVVVPPVVNCVLSEWGAWTPTSAWSACVDSVQTRTEQRSRTVVTQPSGGGTACGVLTETREVEQACVADGPTPVNCVLSDWGVWIPVSDWSACSAGVQTRNEQRSRTVVTEPSDGGTECGVLTETREVSQGCTIPATESTNGLRILLGETGSIIDALGATWTFRGGTAPSDGDVLRNGLWFNGGWGRELLYYSNAGDTIPRVVYHKGYQSGHWLSWNGSTWVDGGTQDPTLPAASANGFTVPDDGASLTDAVGAVWSLSGQTLLRNGSPYEGGWASKIKLWDSVVYHLNPGGLGWIKEDEDGVPYFWEVVGADPEDSTPPATGTFVTTGSISQGSNELQVADLLSFQVNDIVIVEIGMAAGQGQRGTYDVGGSWPSMSRRYASFAAMDAALGSNPDAGYAWVDDGNGWVWRRFGGTWTRMDNFDPKPHSADRYNSKAVPRALRAQIQSIDVPSKTLTLTGGAVNGIAQATVTNANVYHDQTIPLNTALAAGGTISLSGSYPCGGAVKMKNKTGATITGDGQATTRLYSPKGCPSFCLEIWNSSSTTIKDLTVQGNWRDNGFGFDWNDGLTENWNTDRNNQATSDTFIGAGSGPPGIFFNLGSHNSVIQDVTAIDHAMCYIGCAFADNVTAARCTAIQNDPFRQYMQWAFYWTETTGGGCTDCVANSPYYFPSFESFRSTGVTMLRCKGRNCGFSVNASHDTLLQDCETFVDGTVVDVDYYNYQSIGMCVVSTNAGATSNASILRFKVTQPGYVAENSSSIPGVLVGNGSTGPTDTVIDGLDYTAPDYNAASPTNGAQGVYSDAPRTIIKNSIVRGKSKYPAFTNQENAANLYGLRSNGALCVNNVAEHQFYFNVS